MGRSAAPRAELLTVAVRESEGIARPMRIGWEGADDGSHFTGWVFDAHFTGWVFDAAILT